MLFIEIILIDKASLHPGAGARDAHRWCQRCAPGSETTARQAHHRACATGRTGRRTIGKGSPGRVARRPVRCIRRTCHQVGDEWAIVRRSAVCDDDWDAWGHDMNNEACGVILNHFCERRGISTSMLSTGPAHAICATSAPYLLMVECLDQLDPTDPTGGLLAKLIDRAHKTAAGALALVALGHFREAEILARTILESSVTTAYIVHRVPKERLVAFFDAYIKQERAQNLKWKADLNTLPQGAREDHAARIRNKNEALDHYEQLVSMLAAHLGLEPRKAKGWPKLIDMLTELGQRIDYRTVYWAMCSQAHHDAEDVLNHFIANIIEGHPDLSERMERETDTFSLFMLLFGLRWFVVAASAVGEHLDFPTVVAEGRRSLEWLNEELHAMTTHLDTGTFPHHWARPSRDSA